MKRLRVRLAGVTFVWLVAGSGPLGAQRVQLIPHLSVGQTFSYQFEFVSSRTAKADSTVSSPQVPPAMDLNSTGLLHVEVTESNAATIRLKTYFSEKNVPNAEKPGQPLSDKSSPDKIVEVSIAPEGEASQLKGLDQLSAAQQLAWSAWLGRFTSPWGFPKDGARIGQRWEIAEPETTRSPLAKLVWSKKYQYVRDEPCPLSGSQNAQTCAVVLVEARLLQKSSPSNATPPDFKLRNLVTQGTATGSNETILYISRSSGLLVRSSETAEQSMDATIALADGSNRVRYLIRATSRSQFQLVDVTAQGTTVSRPDQCSFSAPPVLPEEL